MENNNLEKIYAERNSLRLGGIGGYDVERGEMFAGWVGMGKKVLDIGCRDGMLTRHFAKGNELIGADVDSQALKLFEKNLNAKTYQIDLNNEWPFQKEEFDAIVASEVLEHLYKPEAVVENIYNSLKLGGIFIGTIPNAFSLANRFRLFLARPQETTLSDHTHVYHFSYKVLKKMLEKYFSSVELVPLTRYKSLSKISPALFSFLIAFHCKK